MLRPHNDTSYVERIRMAVDGGQYALSILFLDCESELFKHVSRELGPTLARLITIEDVYQELWLRAVKSARTIRAKTRREFLAWLKTLAKNRISDLGKEFKAAKRGGDRLRLDVGGDLFDQRSLELAAQLISGEETGSTFAKKREASEAVRVALGSLPESQREAIRLRYFQRLPHAEIAKKMGRTQQSVKGLLERAKASMAKTLQRYSLWLSR